jgi:hypothetical protein
MTRPEASGERPDRLEGVGFHSRSRFARRREDDDPGAVLSVGARL